MKRRSTKTLDQEIPELKREQLGRGVRGKYFKKFMQSSNVVVLAGNSKGLSLIGSSQ